MNTKITIGDRALGAGEPCFIVAEIGINHNGDMDLAKQMIDAAKEAGADSVKFQNYVTEDFLSDRSLMYDYISQGEPVCEPQFDMFKRYELSNAQLGMLKAYCDEVGIIFHSTPTNKNGVDALVALGSPIVKNGSDYLSNLPLVAYMGQSGVATVLSTGMATVADIDESVRAFKATGNQNLVLLHCTSAYPCPSDEVNLRKIPSLQQTFGVPVGFSDHTEGIEAAIGAVVLGACFIEKHFTLDRNLPGPDHRFSSDPAEFTQLVQGVRKIEANLGVSALGLSGVENENREAYRLSCVAARALPKGHTLSKDDIAFRRPGSGLPPAQMDYLIGYTLPHDVAIGYMFSKTDLQK